VTGLTTAVAFVAGFLGFFSPCVLPLLPGYVAFLSGYSLREREAGRGRAAPRVLVAAVLFVLGFSLVFTAMGATASAVGSFVASHRPLLGRLGGVAVFVFGLMVLGLFRVPLLSREYRLRLPGRPVGLAGAVAVGMAFGLAWTPCVGPVLAAVLTLAATAETAQQGSALLFSYAVGMGVPFVAAALLCSVSVEWLKWFRRYQRQATQASGLLLLVMGMAMALGAVDGLNAWVLRLFSSTPAL
jgi:cytochrome c-type biogenesis protein